jgi:hypothetical protein
MELKRNSFDIQIIWITLLLHAVRDDLLTQSMVPLCVSTSVACVCDCRTHRLSSFLSADVDPSVCNGDWLCFSNGIAAIGTKNGMVN